MSLPPPHTLLKRVKPTCFKLKGPLLQYFCDLRASVDVVFQWKQYMQQFTWSCSFCTSFFVKKAWFWIPVRTVCSPIGVFDSLTHAYSRGVPPWTRVLSYTVGDQPSAIFSRKGSQVSMVPECLLGSWPALAINGKNHMLGYHWLVIYDLKSTYRPRYAFMVFSGPITTMTKVANVVRQLMFWWTQVVICCAFIILSPAISLRLRPSMCDTERMITMQIQITALSHAEKKQYLILTTDIINSWGCLNRWFSAMWDIIQSLKHKSLKLKI